MSEQQKVGSSQNFFGLPPNKYGLIDKQGQGVGLSEVNLDESTPQVTLRDHLLYFDTRDCIGQLSLREAQLAFAFQAATDGLIPPDKFKETLDNNGIVRPLKLVEIVNELNNTTESSITGFPTRNSKNSYIEGNKITFKFQDWLKLVKNLDVINVIVPRDIIPMYVYFPGFIQNCIPYVSKGTGADYLNPRSGSSFSTWQSPIPATIEDFIDKDISGPASNKLGGVYHTPLRYWRTYTGPTCLGNPHTPPPYQLWNPPQDFNSNIPWPFQPIPVPGQRIPTYVSKNGVVFSGYGLYDLDDFPEFQNVQNADGTTTQIPLRKLILKLIVPVGQYIDGESGYNLIDNSIVNDFNDTGVVSNPLTETGYGDYQRFLPGPGVGMKYQPNQWRNLKSVPIELSKSTYDTDTGYLGPMPVPFPNFRGNVWGPYGRPGDRFQNASVQQTVDELYLNGDLENLEGNSILWDDWDVTKEPYRFEYYVLQLRRINTIVRFSTFETSTNPNIRNAMRVRFDGGFGAVSVSVGLNTISRGVSGPLEINGLPNTQYDGSIHTVNPDVWITPRDENPSDWLSTLSGPQKPTLVSDQSLDPTSFQGWMYIWRDIFPWTGQVYVPVTAGGVGPMEYFNSQNDTWEKSGETGEDLITTGSSQWSCSPIIGASNRYCIPTTNLETFEYVSNIGWGAVSAITLYGGGTGYQDSFSGSAVIPRYRLAEYSNIAFGTEFVIEANSVNSIGSITAFTRINGSISLSQGILILNTVGCNSSTNGCTINPEQPTSGNNCAIRATYVAPFVSTLALHIGGSNYTIANGVATKSQTGVGTGLTIDITSVFDLGVNAPGVIDGFSIREPGSGYKVGDVVMVFQKDSDNNCLFQITDATDTNSDIIPEYNIFHYLDPLAVGPSHVGVSPLISQNFINSAEVCTSDCPDNCMPLGGEYQVCVGETIADAATACNDPRPIPDPPCMLKCDFVDLENPETKWTNDVNNDQVTCRPTDNARIKQRNSYVERRVAYNDSGPNNGFLITSLLNYRTQYVSSTPDTDIVIRIAQASRDTYTQSLNKTIYGSNFHVPVRLNIGTSSGTLEYIEAVQGTLTSAGVYWRKDFYPPQSDLTKLEMEFFTYDGTPIPLERTLGFNRQINEQAVLLSSSIITSSIIHGSYADFSPKLPPFLTTFTNTPSSTLISGASNSKSLDDPFNPKLIAYTQRNLSIYFRAQCYQAENVGITPIIKKMPDSLIPSQEQFENILPLAGNIEEYGTGEPIDEYDTEDDDVEIYY